MDERERAFRERRRTGIGGSDAGAVLGLSKFRTPLDVYLDKVDEAPEREETQAMKLGKKLEPVVASLYTEDTGIALRELPDDYMAVHPDYPFMIAHPDRLGEDEKLVAELKTTNAFAGGEWGETGEVYANASEAEEGIPDFYVVQLCHYQAVENRDYGAMAVLIGGQDFRYYHMHRDRRFEQVLIRAAEQFWHKHVLPRVPPDPQNVEDLKLLYPKDAGHSIEATGEIMDAVAELKNEKSEYKDTENRIDALEFAIKAFMGAASELVDVDGRKLVTWKAGQAKRFSQKELRLTDPDTYEKYKTLPPSRSMRILA